MEELDQEVRGYIEDYLNSFTKKQILYKWRKLRARTEAGYSLYDSDKNRLLNNTYQELKDLMYQSYHEDFEHPLTEVNFHGWISHCGWVADKLKRHTETVIWLELQRFFIKLDETKLLNKDSEGHLI